MKYLLRFIFLYKLAVLAAADVNHMDVFSRFKRRSMADIELYARKLRYIPQYAQKQHTFDEDAGDLGHRRLTHEQHFKVLAVPTPSPSPWPTPIPSLELLDMPSPHPTRIPTPLPSPTPTPQPTVLPSAHPSPQPSAAPSLDPSADPSPSPSRIPSPLPSRRPTPRPTLGPSPLPTTPTGRPSGQPSQGPSSVPSSMPSLAILQTARVSFYLTRVAAIQLVWSPEMRLSMRQALAKVLGLPLQFISAPSMVDAELPKALSPPGWSSQNLRRLSLSAPPCVLVTLNVTAPLLTLSSAAQRAAAEHSAPTLSPVSDAERGAFVKQTSVSFAVNVNGYLAALKALVATDALYTSMLRDVGIVATYVISAAPTPSPSEAAIDYEDIAEAASPGLMGAAAAAAALTLLLVALRWQQLQRARVAADKARNPSAAALLYYKLVDSKYRHMLSTGFIQEPGSAGGASARVGPEPDATLTVVTTATTATAATAETAASSSSSSSLSLSLCVSKSGSVHPTTEHDSGPQPSQVKQAEAAEEEEKSGGSTEEERGQKKGGQGGGGGKSPEVRPASAAPSTGSSSGDSSSSDDSESEEEKEEEREKEEESEDGQETGEEGDDGDSDDSSGSEESD